MHLKEDLLVLAYMHNFFYLQCLEERLPKSAMIVQFSKGIVQLIGEIAQLTHNWQQWLIVPTVGITAYMLRRTIPFMCFIPFEILFTESGQKQAHALLFLL